jgi:DNA mismatch endonuclease (patch repair protein)
MAAIKGRDTKPEKAVRQCLRAHGVGYRKNYPALPGKPDLVLTKYKTVIFVHGCFWHRHPGCRFATTPETNAGFWEAKFSGTVERDKRKAAELEKLGWMVITLWECEIRNLNCRELITRIRNNQASAG